VPDGFILSAIKAFALVNLLMGFFAIMTVTERKVIATARTASGRSGCSSRSPTSASWPRSSTRSRRARAIACSSRRRSSRSSARSPPSR
jgi:hypothetical protein